MFEKLISLLPYKPELAQQVRFYARRMHQEASVRRTGLVFLVLTFLVQFFAVISPPQPIVADSTNDLLSGGITSAADGKQKCEADKQAYMVILHYYGVSCDAFDNTDDTTLHTGPHEPDYYSMGHNPSYAAGEQSVAICSPDHSECAGTMYWRRLSVWPEPSEGPNGSRGWKALHLKGTGFYVLYDCGNLVFVGVPPHNQLQTPTPPSSAPIQSTTPSAPPASTPPASPPATPTTPVTIAPCQYNSAIAAGSPACFKPCPYNPAVAATSTQCYPPCPYNNLLSLTSSQCKACNKSASGQATDCVEIHKTAANVTTGTSNADGTTANAGDTIVYTLYAYNGAKAGVKGYTFQEDLNDVMDYADPVDLHGGNLGANGIVSWPPTYIAPGQTSTVQITVKVKNPIPTTPPSASDPAHFDLIMTNVYGNAINIKLPSPPLRAVETSSTTALPNTGPGTSLFIAAAVVIVAGYFYGRARLLNKESLLAIQGE